MAARVPPKGTVDEVQIFNAAPLVGGEDLAALRAAVGMASSSNCDISVAQRAPGETLEVPIDSDADWICLILQGSARVEGPSNTQELQRRQGALVPTGAFARFTNTGREPLVVFMLRSLAGEAKPGYVPNVPSGVLLEIPESAVNAGGVQHQLFVYALDDQTFAISSQRTDQLNLASVLRMSCEYTRSGESLIANLPERLVRWYRLRDLKASDYRMVPSPDQIHVKIDIGPLVEREVAARGATA